MGQFLADPFPDFFGRVEPWRVSRQPKDLYPGLVLQVGPSPRMVVNRPVVHHQENPRDMRERLRQVLVEPAHFHCGETRPQAMRQTPMDWIESDRRAHDAVGRGCPQRSRLVPPNGRIGRRDRRLAMESGFVFQQNQGFFALARLLIRLFDGVFFS